MAEGWATFIENRIMDESYGSPSNNSINIENFTMFTRPYTRPFDTEDDEDWFITGLFWDLYDTNTLGSNRGDVVRLLKVTTGDRISTLKEELEGKYKPLFDILDGNTKKVNNSENRIIATYPSIRQRTINTFKAYGY